MHVVAARPQLSAAPESSKGSLTTAAPVPMYPSPTPPSSIKRSRYRFETPQLSRRLAPASIENQATKVAPSGKNSLHETGGSFELNNNDNTGDTFYFRNAMGREAKQWTVPPHTRHMPNRSQNEIVERSTKAL